MSLHKHSIVALLTALRPDSKEPPLPERSLYDFYVGVDVAMCGAIDALLTRKVVYIAGPMRGYRDLNYHAFDEMRDRLAEAGYIPFNPADYDRDYVSHRPEKFDPNDDKYIGETLLRDLQILDDCDGIVFLDGWEDSYGSIVEASFVQLKKLLVLDPETLQESERGISAEAGYNPLPEDFAVGAEEVHQMVEEIL